MYFEVNNTSSTTLTLPNEINIYTFYSFNFTMTFFQNDWHYIIIVCFINIGK